MLAKMLALLVDEFGEDRVKSVLYEVLASRGDLQSSSAAAGRRIAERRGVVDYVMASKRLDDQRRQWILQLAEKFESREFMPTSGDFRRFIEHMGQRPPATKSRNDAFRHLFKIFIDMPVEDLKALASSSMYSGPVQLGVISDAISDSGERGRSKPEGEPLESKLRTDEHAASKRFGRLSPRTKR